MQINNGSSSSSGRSSSTHSGLSRNWPVFLSKIHSSCGLGTGSHHCPSVGVSGSFSQQYPIGDGAEDDELPPTVAVNESPGICDRTPTPTMTAVTSPHTAMIPRGALERACCAIWRRLYEECARLSRPRSLLAMRIHSVMAISRKRTIMNTARQPAGCSFRRRTADC